MNKEIDYYESKLQDLYSRLGKANELVKDLKESKESVKTALDKISEQNQLLIHENDYLHHKIADSHLQLTSPSRSVHYTRRSMTIPLDEIQEKDTPTLSDIDSDIDTSQDPNIEKFLKQINELKAVCQQQGEALIKFQETMESTKEDNDRLQVVLNELENEKKGASGTFGNSDLRCSLTFENLPSPVAMRSPESSMFISTFDVPEFEKKDEKKLMEELKLFHRHQMDFVRNGLVLSHIPGLRI